MKGSVKKIKEWLAEYRLPRPIKLRYLVPFLMSNPYPYTGLKGLSHEIFRFVLFPEYIRARHEQKPLLVFKF
jgi:hypothetical protein